MNQDIEKIVQEICEVDPSLAAQKEEIKGVVLQMINVRPNVEIDTNFINQLKNNLMNNNSLKTPFPNFMRLGFYTLSTLVLLTLVFLVNKDDTREPQGPVTTTFTVSPNSLNVASQLASSNNINIDFVSLSDKKAFAVVHKESTSPGSLGEIIGVSNLLNVGLNSSIPVAVSEAIAKDSVYYVALYGDDGDGKFNILEDDPILDNITSTPMYMMFVGGEGVVNGGVSI